MTELSSSVTVTKEEKRSISKAQRDNIQSSAMGIRDHLQALLVAMRPRQWTKNLALFIGLVFAQQLFYGTSCVRVILAFAAFCLSSSFIYLFNDLLDLEKDRLHPLKRSRPLASGRLPVSWAIAGAGALLLCSGAFILVMFNIPVSHDIYASNGGANILFALSVVAYLLLMVLYSMYLKHVVLIDVFTIATGFVLRLKEYSLPLLDQMITIVVTCTLIAYSLYTFEGPTGNQRLTITIPFVLYGMFRYLYLVYVRMEGGSPEEVLLRDRPMLGTVMVCAILIIAVLYLLPS